MKQNKRNLPDGWRILKVSDCGKMYSGGTPSTQNKEYWNGNIPWISSSDLRNDNIWHISISKFITEEALKNSTTKKVPKNSILVVNRVGVGKIAIAPVELCTSQDFQSIILKQEEVDVYFFASLIKNKIENLVLRCNQGSAIKGFKKEDLADLKILLPPIEEQRRIAEVLSTWDEGIENLEKLIALKEKQKRALMQRLLTGKTRLKGFSKPWKEARLGDIGDFSSAGVDKKIIEGELPVLLLNYMDIYRNKFISSQILKQEVTATLRKKENCNIKKGDIFFTPSSETRDDIGHSAVAIEDIENGVYSYHIVRLRPKQEIDLNFSAYIFETSLFYKQVYTICEGSGQRYVISLDDFRKIIIKIPATKEEQIEIGRILTTYDNEISQQKNKLELFKQQKKYLMQQLLTGKKRLI